MASTADALRTCGTCSMCCKILDISELAKPANKWCQHVIKGAGCSIYDVRPTVCRGYMCGWILDDSLGEEWKPEHSKFIIHRVAGRVGIWINVDANQPLSWRKAPYYAEIKQWSEVAWRGEGYVAVCFGTRTIVVFPEVDLEVAGVGQNDDLKVGYRHSGGTRRPLVILRKNSGEVTEFLGEPLPAIGASI